MLRVTQKKFFRYIPVRPGLVPRLTTAFCSTGQKAIRTDLVKIVSKFGFPSKFQVLQWLRMRTIQHTCPKMDADVSRPGYRAPASPAVPVTKRNAVAVWKRLVKMMR